LIEIKFPLIVILYKLNIIVKGDIKMTDFIIMSDSCSDLPNDYVIENKIPIVPLRVHFKEETFQNFPDGREITNKDFYERLRNKEVATTSQASPEGFIEVAEPFLKKGLDIISFAISSSLSGTANAMMVGRQTLLDQYPDRKIFIVDSLSASLGEGLLIFKAVEMKKAGLSIDEIYEKIESIKLKNAALFTVNELGTLQRGGRISLTKALLGTLLNMKPALHLNDDGKLVPWDKARGRKNALAMILNRYEELVENEDIVILIHSDCLEETERVKEELMRRRPNIKQLIIGEVGPVIGAHTGPGVVGLAFIAKHR
jgi:DegV family protein with EDD domain